MANALSESKRQWQMRLVQLSANDNTLSESNHQWQLGIATVILPLTIFTTSHYHICLLNLSANSKSAAL